MTVGPLTSKSVSAALKSTAIGLAVGIGEILESGVAPTIAGYIAHHHGIETLPDLLLPGAVHRLSHRGQY